MADLTKEQARNTLWIKGVLNYKLRSYQKELEAAFQNSLSKKAKLLAANCSRRWGKSTWAIKKAIEVARRPGLHRGRIKYGAAFLTDLEEITIPLFQKLLEDCPAPLKPQWKASQKKYVFPTIVGSKVSWDKCNEIKLAGLDRNPDGLRGGYSDLIVIEEAGFVSGLSYLYSSVMLPMTIKRPDSTIIMIGTPPSSPNHDFYTFCQKAKIEDSYIERNIYTNTTLTQEEIETIHRECLSETDWLREYMCQFVIDERLAIIPEFNAAQIKKVDKPDNFKHYHKYVVMDLGVKRDKTVAIFGYRDFLRNKTVITHECQMWGPAMTTKKLANMIKEKEQEAFGDLPVQHRWSDNNNPLLLQDLRQAEYGLPFFETNKDELHAMVNQLRVNIHEYEIDPSCTELIGCLQSGLWDERRKEFARSDLYGHYDALAALIYFERNTDRMTNPIPNVWDENKYYPGGFKKQSTPMAYGLTQLYRKS